MAGRSPKRKPLFYFEALSYWDKIVIGVYSLATITVLLYIGWGADGYKNDIIFFYALIPQVFNYVYNYRSLRNLKFYFTWVGFAFIQICLYFYLKDDPFYGRTKGFLLNTFVLLILYQLLRIASLKFQNQDWAVPTKDGKDLFSDRRITFLDCVLFVIYWGSLCCLSFFAGFHLY